MFDVRCPCCNARMIIDEHTRKVVSHTTEEDQSKSTNDRFSDSLGKVARAKAAQDGKFQEAREKERRRKEQLASLFDDAAKKVEKEGPVEKPPERYWD